MWRHCWLGWVVSRLTNDSALVAIHGSRWSGNVLLDNIESQNDRWDIRTVEHQISYAKQDLPRQQGGKQWRREGDPRVTWQKRLDVVPEGNSGGDGVVGRRKREDVVEICSNPVISPGSLHRPVAHYRCSGLVSTAAFRFKSVRCVCFFFCFVCSKWNE